MAESDSLFYLRNQFYLGSYKAVSQNPPPSKDSPEYLPALLYTARSHIALNQPSAALSLLLPADIEPPVRAVRALANYIQKEDAGEDYESLLDELRDLTIEVDDAEDEGVEGAGAGVVKLCAATAFIKEEELEEALTTLGAGSGNKDLECVYLTIQIYLSINRPDMARKEFTLLKSSSSTASDSLLYALSEAAIGTVTGGAPLNSAYHIYDEQVSAPGSSMNANIIASKGVMELMKGHLNEAMASFDEALGVDAKCEDALVGRAVGKQLSGKQSEADEAYNALNSIAPDHPYIEAIDEKSDLFDTLKGNYAAAA